MAVSMQRPGGQEPPREQVTTSQLQEFAFQAGANAAGTLIAIVVGYLWLSLFGIIKPNHRLVVSLSASLWFGAVYFVVFWLFELTARSRLLKWPAKTAAYCALVVFYGGAFWLTAWILQGLGVSRWWLFPYFAGLTALRALWIRSRQSRSRR